MRLSFSLLSAVLTIAFLMSSCRDEVPPAEVPPAEVPPAEVPPAPGEPVPEPVVEKGVEQKSDADFVGLSEKDGAALAGKRGLRHRVVSVDGELRPTTRDYRKDRVNFELEGGKIVKVSRG